MPATACNVRACAYTHEPCTQRSMPLQNTPSEQVTSMFTTSGRPIDTLDSARAADGYEISLQMIVGVKTSECRPSGLSCAARLDSAPPGACRRIVNTPVEFGGTQ